MFTHTKFTHRLAIVKSILGFTTQFVATNFKLALTSQGQQHNAELLTFLTTQIAATQSNEASIDAAMLQPCFQTVSALQPSRSPMSQPLEAFAKQFRDSLCKTFYCAVAWFPLVMKHLPSAVPHTVISSSNCWSRPGCLCIHVQFHWKYTHGRTGCRHQ